MGSSAADWKGLNARVRTPARPRPCSPGQEPRRMKRQRPAVVGANAARAIGVPQSCHRRNSAARTRRYACVRHRTDRRAMRLIVEPLAFGTLVGVDLIGEAADADRRIRTFQLASPATGAQRGDDLVRHDLISDVGILWLVGAIKLALWRAPTLSRPLSAMILVLRYLCYNRSVSCHW